MSTVKMTKRGNVRVDGVKYKAVEHNNCRGCAFSRDHGEPSYEPACRYSSCGPMSRDVEGYRLRSKSVIFVKAV